MVLLPLPAVVSKDPQVCSATKNAADAGFIRETGKSAAQEERMVLLPLLAVVMRQVRADGKVKRRRQGKRRL